MASSKQDQLFINRCVSAAALVLLYYDYVLTLSDEIERYWMPNRKITIASALFYMNRYLSLLGHLPNIVEYFWISTDPERLTVCTRLISAHYYTTVVIQIVIGAMLFVRTKALYGRDRRILYLLSISAIIIIGYGGWSVFTAPSMSYVPGDLLEDGCFFPISNETARRFANAWTAMLSFDVLVCFLTLYKAFTMASTGASSVLDIIVRDGSLHFGVMVVACISVIVSFHVSPDYLKGLTGTLTNILSSVMVTRLMLNLRKLGSAPPTQEFPSVAFRNALQRSSTTGMHDGLPTSMLSEGTESYELRTFERTAGGSRIDT
ncbi:hypothetical protein CPB83DRAFT_902292 [Crepidotus variabilis]|uniref:DUF6533 domain-containing protein n=1 Tax=Crepidotus variabilis TaxID=179855 RepID=A0A9P6ESB4_9AGAR|nr:hypothetical protein CPB83DRAFT_902292 [Crepidotus variabilis]